MGSWSLAFRVLGFRVLGFGGFGVLGFRVLGFTFQGAWLVVSRAGSIGGSSPRDLFRYMLEFQNIGVYGFGFRIYGLGLGWMDGWL